MRNLVHLTTGVENPTKAALALLVASTAPADGHEVDVLVAGAEQPPPLLLDPSEHSSVNSIQ